MNKGKLGTGLRQREKCYMELAGIWWERYLLVSKQSDLNPISNKRIGEGEADKMQVARNKGEYGGIFDVTSNLNLCLLHGRQISSLDVSSM